MLSKYTNSTRIPVSVQNIKEYFKMNGLTELILKTTDECNLRCKYCVYSSHYPYTNSYSTNRMQFSIAKKAVDYYIGLVLQQSKYIKGKRPFIAFYGGEPLLNFEIVHDTIEYVKENYTNIEINFTVTTNGLPLKDPRISDYLKKNNVIICLSLDGYEENHDRNRLKIDNAPTFQEINSIISNSFLDYPFIYSLCCIDYKTDLLKLYNHYMNNDRMNGGTIPHLLRVSRIYDVGTTYYDQFTEAEKQNFIFGFKWLENLYKQLAIKGESNWFLDLMIGQELMQLYDRPKFSNISGYYSINGCCLPGEKIYVYPNGDFGICEKVAIDNLIIGNVDYGLNFEAIKNLVDMMNDIMDTRCKNCSTSSLCTICYAQLTKPCELGFSSGMCEDRRKVLLHRLTTILEIELQNPYYFKDKLMKTVEKNMNAENTKDALLNIMMR